MRKNLENARLISDVLEALFFLIWARLFVVWAPFPRIAAFLGEAGGHSLDKVEKGDSDLAIAVRARVRFVCRRLGWRPTCLVKAIAATAMLRRLGLTSTCYFGVKTGDAANLRAHAWVSHGPVIVVGERCCWRYTQIHHFVSGSGMHGGLSSPAHKIRRGTR